MSDLGSLLLGIALTLLATLFVQGWVVPRVQARTRREDRWERNVIALGELLTLEQPEASMQLIGAMQMRALLGDRPFDPADPIPEDDPMGEAQDDGRAASDEAYARYEQVESRINWLADQVEANSSGTATAPAISFKEARLGYLDAALGVHALLPNLDYDKVQALRQKERSAVDALLSAVKGLLR